MKTIALSSLSLIAAIFLGATSDSHAKIISGPIVNPTNGHEYYLLDQASWTASEAEAETLGGTLAIIRNAAEQEWVYSKFGSDDGKNRSLWIGLHKNYSGAPFAWMTGEPVDYLNWYSGQPDNAGGMENFVQVLPGGKWNDNTDTANPVCGVVEVPGKSNPKSLSEKERALVGTWYVSGKTDHPSHITATENQLFGIDNNYASRLIYTPDGQLFSSSWISVKEI